MSAAEALARRIARDGPVTVAEFMATALLHPRYGYYMRSDPLGSGGDFITAPETHQIFGESLAAWCIDLWTRAGAPSPYHLVELGPGRGTLMQDILHAARSVTPEFVNAARIWLVEASPVFREQQQHVLPEANFAHDLGNVPEGFTIALANEFLDALPVRQFTKRNGHWEERLVGWNPERREFAFTLSGCPSPFANLLAIDASEGSVAEFSPAAHAVAAGLADRIRTFSGAALVLDYGRDKSEPAGTLQAVCAHERDNPLRAPGEADISTRVDFAALAETVTAEGAMALGPIAQGIFLERLRIRDRAQQLAAIHPDHAGEIKAALSRLLDADEMGSRFRTLGIADPNGPEPEGFRS